MSVHHSQPRIMFTLPGKIKPGGRGRRGRRGGRGRGRGGRRGGGGAGRGAGRSGGPSSRGGGRGGGHFGGKRRFDDDHQQGNKRPRPNETSETKTDRPGGLQDTSRRDLQASLRRLQHQRVVEANKEMAQHASRKQLIEAREIFDKLESAGTANDHTYAVIINACVRCGDLESALKLHRDMINANNVIQSSFG